jgi:RNA polymerase sigma factor (sigma-70 family)
MSGASAGTLLRHVRRLLAGRYAAPDGELLERFARQGDESAFAALMQRHGPLVWGVCRRVLGHEADAEDAFQATFLVLARKAQSVRRAGAVGSFLYGVAYRLSLRARATAARRGRHERQAAEQAPLASPDDVTWRELREVLDAELARLPERYRAPLLLCYLEGQTQDEAARQLGWKKRTVKARLDYGREMLRGRLARRGLPLAAALTAPLLTGGEAPAAARLVPATAKAAVEFAAGKRPEGLPGPVLALAEGGVKAMFLLKLRLAAAGLLALAVLGGGTGLLLSQAPRQAPAGGDKPAGRVDLYGDPLPPGAALRLGTVRFRHESNWGDGTGVLFSPDGKTVVTWGGRDWGGGRSLRFWETATGRRLGQIEPAEALFRSLAWSPDGRLLASAGTGQKAGDPDGPGVVRLWDAATRKEARTLAWPDEAKAGQIAFTPDGKQVVAAASDGSVRFWDVATGAEVLRFRFGASPLGGLAVAPGGKLLAVTGDSHSTRGDRAIHLWEWASNKPPRKVAAPERGVTSLAFAPDGKTLAAGSDDRHGVYLWDVASGRLLWRLSEPDGGNIVRGVAFTPDGKTLAATAYSYKPYHFVGGITLYDLASGAPRRRLVSGGESPEGVAVSRDGRWVAARTNSGARVWDLASGREVGGEAAGHRSEANQVVAAAGGLIATGGDDTTVRLWDGATGRQRHRLDHGGWVRAVAVSPDGSKVASSSLDDTVRLWDAASGREIYKLAGHGDHGGHRALRFTPDGRRLLAFGDDFYLRVWDVRNGKALAEHAIRPTGVKVPDPEADDADRERFELQGEALFTADGKRMFVRVGTEEFVFDVSTGKERRKLTVGGRFWVVRALSPDGRSLLVSEYAQATQVPLPGGKTRLVYPEAHPVVLYDVGTGREVWRTFAAGFRPGAVAFSPDGKLVAATGDGPQGRIGLWDAATGKEAGTVEGVTEPTRALTFSPDGKRLIAGMQDTTVLVWELAGKVKK